MIQSPYHLLLVLGDVMLDRYTHGTVRRVSPEAPVQVLEADREEYRLGGAGAVAALLAGLGAMPIVAGVIGSDPAGEVVMRLLANPPLPPGEGRGEGGLNARTAHETPQAPTSADVPRSVFPSLLRASGRPTTVKERFVASTRNQQLLRVDRESCRPIAEDLEHKLLAAVLAALEELSGVLISDYGKGVCTPKIVSAVIAAARKRGLPVLVDPRRGADYALYRFSTVIKPNRHEAGEATGREIRTLADAFAAGRELCARWGFKAAAITLDGDGLVLVTADGLEQHFAAHDREVADVTGAGDTVLAVLGAALARGVELADACRLAVTAAGLQVERFGVSPVSWHEIVGEDSGSYTHRVPGVQGSAEPTGSVGNGLRAVPLVAMEGRREGTTEPSGFRPFGCPSLGLSVSPSLPRSASPCSHCPVPCSLCSTLALHRARGERIVFTNGCFDLLHAGHLHCLMAAKALGDVLVVAINSDAGVRRLKGDSRPIVGQRDRAALLAALVCVDYVTIFDDDTPERLIAQLRPDILVKGDEPRPEGIPGEAIVRSYGGRVELIPHLPDRSTTALVTEVARLRANLPLPLGAGRGVGELPCATAPELSRVLLPLNPQSLIPNPQPLIPKT